MKVRPTFTENNAICCLCSLIQPPLDGGNTWMRKRVNGSSGGVIKLYQVAISLLGHCQISLCRSEVVREQERVVRVNSVDSGV